MKLVLIDDDKIITDSMPSAFPWADWGITEIRTAYSVKQAKKILEEDPADILLCDIEMPMGTGIELVEWIQEALPRRIVTILLTCHPEFGYARRALQLGCSNYLLKPAEEGELKRAVLDAEEKVMELRRREKERLIQESRIRDMDTFWETLFSHRISGGEKLWQICEEYGVDRQSRVLPILVSVKHHSFRIRDVSRTLLSFVLENVIREMLCGQKFGLVNGHDERLWLFFPENPNPDPKEALARVTAWMQEKYYSALSCYFGLPQPLTEWEKECDLLAGADKRFVASPRMYSADQVRHRGQLMSELPEQVKSGCVNLFAAGRYANLLQKLREYLEGLTPDQCNPASLEGIMRRLDQEFEKSLEKTAGGRFHKIQIQLLKENSENTKSIPGLLEYYERMFSWLEEEACEKEQEPILERVKLYISMNIQQDLGREQVAAYVGLNPDYLNRIFKKETGLSLKEYISERKIQMACELLEQTDFLVGEIGEMVGYVNFSSFTTFFKNRTGMTPAAWRKEHSG